MRDRDTKREFRDNIYVGEGKEWQKQQDAFVREEGNQREIQRETHTTSLLFTKTKPNK